MSSRQDQYVDIPRLEITECLDPTSPYEDLFQMHIGLHDVTCREQHHTVMYLTQCDKKYRRSIEAYEQRPRDLTQRI